jgi:hypothetical protein
MMVTDDPFLKRTIAVGHRFQTLMGQASIERCNCMVRFGNGDSQRPAIRKGKLFYTPEGDEISPPSSFEDMQSDAIRKIMDARGEVYIGHLLGPFAP